MNTKWIAMLAAAATFGLAGAATAQVVPDSSFESPNLGNYAYRPTVTSVAFYNNAGIASNTFGPGAEDGTQFGFLQGGGGEGGARGALIVFSLSGLTVGSTYDVTFYGAQRPGYPVYPIDVSFGTTTPLGTFTPTSASSYDFFTTGTFTASATTGQLRFFGIDTALDLDSAIDNVSVNAIASLPGGVPEPASWALMILGVGATGAALRRRSTAARLVAA